MSWEDDIAGVKDVIDGTGSVDVTLPRQAKLRVSGTGVTVTPNPVDGRTELAFAAQPAPALSSATPAAVGTGAAGVSALASRSDHVHAHGNQAGGSLHNAATTVAAGFQSAADKLKQDATGVARSTLQTTDATPAALATATPADETLVTLRATICGLQSTGANGVGYVIVGTFRRDGGTTVQVGSTTVVHAVEDAALSGAAVAFNVTTPAAQVQVTGVAATTINWACVLETITVP